MRPEITCQGCKHFDAYDLREGACRRFPPTPTMFYNAETDTKQLVWVQPTVAFEDWCGESVERVA